jgi:hypothetical protein
LTYGRAVISAIMAEIRLIVQEIARGLASSLG